MAGAPTPPILPEPFANAADPSFITTIPDTTGAAGRASYRLGFPPLTMQPVAGGGEPPFGQDMNGILFALSAHDYYIQAGQRWPFNAAVAAAIGGYSIGAVVQSADGFSLWYNNVSGNTTDPDNDSSGSGWTPWATGPGISPIGPGGVVSGGTVVVPPSIARTRFLSINGTLTSNLAVVMPSGTAWDGIRWVFINNTTGGFTTTVRTASGTGVVIPQGGISNPVEVFDDGASIYPVTPLAALTPVSQAAAPLTLAERDNLSRIFASTFNIGAAADNPTFTYAITDDGSGFLRKNTVASFAAQIAAAVLANAALTGVPTAPTASVGTSNTQVASTAFASPPVVVNANGVCVPLPNGYKLQFGNANPNGGTAAVTYPVPFTANARPFGISIASGSVATWLASSPAPTLTGFSLSNSGGSAFWFAIGI